MKTILCLAVLLVAVNQCSGLKCYICSATEDDADTTCVDNPSGVNQGTLDCDKKYCTIVRIDYKDPRGKLASIGRSCTDQPIYTNEVVEDETHRSYFRSCRTDLCNGGSGRTESTDTASGSLGDKSTIYCPGMGGSSVRTVGAWMLVVVGVLCHLL